MKRTKKRIGIFGLKGDPIHHFHLLAPERARVQFKLDEVWFVLAGQPVDKLEGVTDKYKRLRMARKSIRGNPHFKLSTFEIDHDGPSYTIETLRHFRATHGENNEYFLIIGEDRAPSIRKTDKQNGWKDWDKLGDLCTALVMPRMNGEISQAWLDEVMPANLKAHAITLKSSSTAVRELVELAAKRGLHPRETLRYLVDDATCDEIATLGLYGYPPRRRTLMDIVRDDVWLYFRPITWCWEQCFGK